MSKGDSSSKRQRKKKSNSPQQAPKSSPHDSPQPDSSQVVKEIDELPPEKREAVFSAIRATYSGPLPPAGELQAYEQVAPGAAERIITMAEEEAKHRRKQEEKMIASDCGDSRLGLWLGFIIGMAALGLSGFISYIASPTTGGLLAGTLIVSLVGVFVYGSRQQKQEPKQNKKK